MNTNAGNLPPSECVNKGFPLASELQFEPFPEKRKAPTTIFHLFKRQFPRKTSLNAGADAEVVFDLPKTEINLEDLPEELVANIVGFLGPIELINLTLVNKRCRRIAVDPLYRAFRSADCEGRLFLRAIVGNPELAQHVKRLAWSYNVDAARDVRRCVPSNKDWRMYRSSIAALGIPRDSHPLWTWMVGISQRFSLSLC